jgi:hypothetical protein
VLAVRLYPLLALVLVCLAALPAEGVRFIRSFENIPLESPPSDMVVDDGGGIWFALPGQSALGLYLPDTGLSYIRLGFKATDLAHGAGAVAAYSTGLPELAVVDVSSRRILYEASGPGMINAVVPLDQGFAVIKRLPTLTQVQQITPTGEVLWETSITVELESYGVAAGSGKYVWLRTVEGPLLMLEAGREGYREYRLGWKPVILASTGGKVWAINPEGEAALVSIRGVERRVNLETRVYLGYKAFALARDNMVLLSPVTEILLEVTGSGIAREGLPEGVSLAASRGGIEVYVLDKSFRNIVVASFSRPPTISDASATPSGDGASISVRARVSDPDDDLAGDPRAIALLGTTVVTAPMTRSGDTYQAELKVPEGDGTVRVMVEASDMGGNSVRNDLGTFEVSAGKVKGAGTPPPQTAPQEDLQSFLLLSVEMALLVVLIAAIGLVFFGRSRRRGRRKR